MSHDQSIFVRTPSRLHFGLLSFGNPNGRQFGGVGAMIDGRGVWLRVEPASTFSVVGPLKDRVRVAASRWLESVAGVDDLRCRIEVVSAPQLHTGLGVGTQLALAVGAGLNAFFGRTRPTAEELAASVGRGQRSAIGTYGFHAGGLIAEQGKLPTESISPLYDRVPLPAAWRFVLAAPAADLGLHGVKEQSAFDDLPPVPNAVTEQLTGLLCERILPAAQSANFSEFSNAVYEFGRLSGSCFETIQGSPYNGRELQDLVEHLRASGVSGVGQSSWGPTIYSVRESATSANRLVEQLRSHKRTNVYDLVVAAPNNAGATVSGEPCNQSPQ